MESKQEKVKAQDPVKVEFLKDTQFHKKGEKKSMHKLIARKLEAKKVVKIVKES